MGDGIDVEGGGDWMYFRNEVTTAMSRLATPAWTAIRALRVGKLVL